MEQEVLTPEEEKVTRDLIWNRLFDFKVQKDLLRYCVYSISLNDDAHNLDHVMDVCRLGKRIAKQLQLSDRDTLLVYVGCLLHDIGCRYERKQHHLIGYGLVYELLSRYWPGEFTDDELLIMATAVLEHRSSNAAKPSSLISSIVSVADSGAPDFEKYVKRAVQFRLDQKFPEELLVSETYKHLLEKFGAEGYHWSSYPDLGMEFFKAEWDDFTNQLYFEEKTTDLIRSTYKALGGGSGSKPD